MPSNTNVGARAPAAPVFRSLQGRSDEAPLAAHFSGGRILGKYCALAHGARTGATGYVGGRLAAPPRRGGPARARARPAARARCTDVDVGRAATSSPAPASRRRSTAARPPTTSSTRWSRRPATATSPTATGGWPRRFGEAAAPTPASSGSSTSAGSCPPTRRALAAPALPPRGRGDPAGRRARLHRPARVDRDRRGVVLVSHPRSPRGAAARAAAAAPGARTAPSRSTSAT